MRLMDRRGAALCLVFLGLSVSSARADEPVPNVELMNRLTGEVVTDLMGRMEPKVTSREVTLVAPTDDERYQFIDNVFTRLLTEKGFRVRRPGGATGAGSMPGPAGGLRIEYQATDFSLVYPKIYRSYMIGGRTVERNASVGLIASLVDAADESVIWVGDATRSHEDNFAFGNIDAVETGVYSFSKPPRESTNWAKIAEPVVVSGIIVGLIYLFFSNQTQN